MQFIPTTWQEIGATPTTTAVKDPHDIDDAALAAGNYLCKGGRDLTIPGDWWSADPVLQRRAPVRPGRLRHGQRVRHGAAARERDRLAYIGELDTSAEPPVSGKLDG